LSNPFRRTQDALHAGCQAPLAIKTPQTSVFGSIWPILKQKKIPKKFKIFLAKSVALVVKYD
jgi:hypothetical protein